MRRRRARSAGTALAMSALLTVGVACSSAGRPDPGGSARPSVSPTPPPTGYSALGDSYSSGLGAGEYLPGTDTATDKCRRSPAAYGPLLDPAQNLGKLIFVACSGAVTADLVQPNAEGNTDPATGRPEPAQISTIAPQSRFVTLTIGGNDAGFADVLSQCVLGKVGPITVFPRVFASFDGCHNDTDLQEAVNLRLQGLAGVSDATTADGDSIVPIADVLKRIHERAPRARIFLAGYPTLFGTVSGSCHVGDVKVLHVPLAGDVRVRLTVSAADTAWLNDAAGRLNDVLRDGVDKAAAAGVPAEFVDVSPRFAGHRLCDTQASWIGPVSGSADVRSRKNVVDSASFHPNALGQRDGYRAALEAAGVR